MFPVVASFLPELGLFKPFIDNGISNICHQDSQKLIEFGQYSTMVCARCFGIYLGGAASLVLVFISCFSDVPRLKLLAGTSFILLSDVLLVNIGVYNYSKTLAFITGFLLGSVGFLYFYIPLEKFIIEKIGNQF
ncbi:MAG: DUF2085 domain-containing protein [Melioribacteraceae bacterium]|nr:DUF2085 domain-containing protein [Melioribacteraceae bacterium]